ncbi:hypothetical protein [Convivina praedatoris]|uniref:Uncharacterized protein n=1 Tax=Convivina praedatoris TaxID=2880963 RepID=A0ABM9D4E9_9LACO|nr:hypothetical protein [Convivina sp. LMG 32447]CAH1857167.1 hypothetical protein LMG032447_01465 [Convivina sp. LMG 32447]
MAISNILEQPLANENDWWTPKHCIQVYPHKYMTRDEVYTANAQSDYIVYIKCGDQGEYVLDDDLWEAMDKYDGKQIMPELQDLDDIDWEKR